MSDALARLEPRPVWEQFSGIADVPRPSKHEERIAAHVRAWAEGHGFTVHTDRVGNLVVDVPATPGHEGAPVVILQGHLDMVCEKNKDTEHDFLNDPIQLVVEGEWVHARGTTLGADNGIGVASAMAAATDPSVIHGPLQLLFTLDEETGLTGAMGLDASLLKGRTLLNLDSEEDGVLFVGCAGGTDAHLFLAPSTEEPPQGAVEMEMEVTGLRGGHSGLNINENRGNALKLLARLLHAAVDDGVDLRIAFLRGGSKHNAIPREADARIFLQQADVPRFQAAMDRMKQAFGVELAGVDDGLELRLSPTEGSSRVLSVKDRDRFLAALLALPHGVLGMSRDLEGLVETSNNLAVVEPAGEEIKIVTSSRSSVMPALDAVVLSIRAVGHLAGARVEIKDGYPGWKPNLDSPVLGMVRAVYREIWKKDPEVTAIHAGLECGLLGERVPGLDMISFGPQIEGAHSPEERVHVPSVQRFYGALREVLKRLAEKK